MNNDGRNNSMKRRTNINKLLPEIKKTSDSLTKVYYSPGFIEKPEVFDYTYSKFTGYDLNLNLSNPSKLKYQIGALHIPRRLPSITPTRGTKISETFEDKRPMKRNLNLGNSSEIFTGMMKRFEFSNKKKYKCFIGSGNVESLVRVLKKRSNWQFLQEINDPGVQFIWKQTNAGINFNVFTNQTSSSLRIINHFEFHHEITQKDRLLANFARYCQGTKLNVFDFLPPSFEVKIDSKNISGSIEGIEVLFNLITNSKKNDGTIDLETELHNLREVQSQRAKQARSKLSLLFQSTTEIKEIPAAFNRGKNLWIIKPNDCNRGIGIELITKAAEFPKIVQSIDQKVKQMKNLASPPRKLLMQKYIENPLLIEGRKFDIRVWVLLDSFLNVYVFPEGYLRMSGEIFSLADTSKTIHLTNNAVQKNSESYGKFEKGNQLSFKQFQEYLDKEMLSDKIKWSKNLYPAIIKLIKLSFESVKQMINSNKRENCFELFGFDFMIDDCGGVWLLEVNTNPCLALSSPLLEVLIPRMLDDALKLTLDVAFAPDEDRLKEAYPVDGYDDERNMWSPIG